MSASGILALMLVISTVSPALCATKGLKASRRSRQAPPQQPAAPMWPPPAPARPVHRYALVPVDAMGRPVMGPAAPPPPFPPRPAPLPMMFPRQPIAPPPPPQVIHIPAPMPPMPPMPPPRVIVQAPPPPQPQIVYVTQLPSDFCGAPKEPGECCDPSGCLPMFHVDEEDRPCLPSSVCCAVGHCD